jgi:hypothetical protein
MCMGLGATAERSYSHAPLTVAVNDYRSQSRGMRSKRSVLCRRLLG